MRPGAPEGARLARIEGLLGRIWARRREAAGAEPEPRRESRRRGPSAGPAGPSVAHGAWEPETDRRNPHGWTGRCQRCGAHKPAVALEWRLRPFGRGEEWRCRGGCDASRFDRR